MRYQDWDVLLFPDQFKVPLQEFKTTCQVIQDPESHNLQSNPLLLPTVTSFIPGLLAGAAFRVSIHCWQNPETSRYVHTLKKPSDIVMFEARLFIDGRLAGSKWFNQNGPWPTIIELSVDIDKHGEFEKLRFPTFHKELLSQSYWNPGDDLGRVKVIISEGFSREQPTYPFERIKNIVSFSFQHAPLDVLEASSIAWPNATMWRQVSLVGPYFSQQFSPRQGSDGIDAHSHSPRHGQATTRATFSAPNIGSMPPPPLFPRQPTYDPFTEPGNPAFTGWRHTSSTDTSMPDYSSSITRASSTRQVSDPMQYEKTGRFESIQMPGAFESLCEALLPAAPVNTPDNGFSNTGNIADTINPAATRKTSSKMSVDFNYNKLEKLPTTTIHPIALNPDGTSSVKSRKENIQDSPLVVTDINPGGHEHATRKIGQPLSTMSIPAGTAESNPADNENIIHKSSQPPTMTFSTIGTGALTAAEKPIRKPSQPSTTTNLVGPLLSSTSTENPIRRVSRPFTTTNNSGSKRQRVVTPAAAKVIDDEDEPRSSPSRASMRRTSQTSVKTDNKENERVVLGGIENV